MQTLAGTWKQPYRWSQAGPRCQHLTTLKQAVPQKGGPDETTLGTGPANQRKPPGEGRPGEEEGGIEKEWREERPVRVRRPKSESRD